MVWPVTNSDISVMIVSIPYNYKVKISPAPTPNGVWKVNPMVSNLSNYNGRFDKVLRLKYENGTLWIPDTRQNPVWTED